MKGKGKHDYSQYSREAYDQLPLKTKASIKQAHLDRAAQGKEAWNEWAKEFEKEINNAVNEYVIDFIEMDVPEAVSFEGFIFPCEILFLETVFFGITDFSYAQFRGPTQFVYAQFRGPACFKGAKFSGIASFSRVQFRGPADFIRAQFSGKTYFGTSQFGDTAYFTHSQFSSETYFDEAQFSGRAYFDEAQFSGRTTFNEAKYEMDACYVSANFKNEVTLENTAFEQVPNFNFATFNQPPHLSSISIAEPADKSEKGLVERYRKIKKMAIQSNDFQNELSFFGLETHAKAYLETTPRSERAFIKAYKLLSDFGQSIGRPLVALLVFLTAMCVINGGYMAMANPISENCVAHKLKYASAVVQYTFSQASPLFNVEAEREKEIEECLFQKKSLDIRNSIWRLAHLLPTTLLLFIFGLAVRNRFKIR